MGATVLLYRGDGVQLFETHMFEPGRLITLDNYAPVLPDGPEAVIDFPVALPNAGSGGLAAESPPRRTTVAVGLLIGASALAGLLVWRRARPR